MSKSSHTPGPWQWIDADIVGDPTAGPNKNWLVGPPRDPRRKPYAVSSSVTILRLDEPIENEANAAFIVRACNAHDELVAALKVAVKDVCDGCRRGVPFNLAGSHGTRLGLYFSDCKAAYIRAALSKAEGQK